MKTCKKCKETLPLTAFHKHAGFKDGRRIICAKCCCERSAEYYKNNRQKHMDCCKEWQRRNQDKVLRYQKSFKKRQQQSSRDWIKNNPKLAKAQKSLNYAVFKGTVVRPDNCQVCGCVSDKIEAHHSDYTKPLEVIWVCTSCHGWIHRKRTHETVKVLSK